MRAVLSPACITWLVFCSRVLIAALFLIVASSGNAQAPNSEHTKRRVLYAPPPQYPFVARARRWTGAGIFACNLRPDGTVASVDVVRSTGHDVLDDAATSTLRRWKFAPGGSHVVRVPLSFTIGGVRHRMSGAVISD
jgi:TonB family protein